MAINDVEHCEVHDVHRDLVNRIGKEMPSEDELYDLAELFKVFGDSTTFIVPSPVHSNLSYKPLRALMLDNHWLREVCYTGGDVFKEPTVDTTIHFYSIISSVHKRDKNRRVFQK